jgi:glycine/D-amino acid oxidase-like deaminating enzyme
MARPTFPDYSNLCGWNAMLPQRQPNPALTTDISVDYAVVGAGYTGLAAARRLHELDPQARIVVLEATTVGEGSSGRNSGFTNPRVLPTALTAASTERAQKLSAIYAQSFDWIREIALSQGDDCDMQQVGALRGAATELGEASLRKSVKFLKASKIAHTELDRAGIRDRVGADYYRYGYLMHDTWLMQPAKLIRALAKGLPEAVTLHEKSPVRAMRRDGAGWRLVSDGGSVRAPVVVLATNGFIPKFGYLGTKMATIFTYAAVTEAVKDADLGHLGQSDAWGLLPAHRLGTTLRRIGRDRLMVRSLYAHKAEVSQDYAVRELRERFERRWPGLRHVPFAFVWGGTTAFTMNGAPAFGQVDQGVYASGGCNGAGITKGTVLGRGLAEIIKGGADPAALKALTGEASFIAPEPFRTVGFEVISRIERRRAGLES